MKKLWKLFWIFFKIGAFTFGGGLGMIPFITKEIVDKNKWLDNKEMLDIIAIAQSTPGVIAVNTATYVGAKVKGFWGAVFSSIGVMLPSFLIIIIISPFIVKYRQIKLVSYALIGVRSAVVVLIASAVIRLYKANKMDIFNITIMVITFLLITLSQLKVLPFNVDIVFILIGCALIGIIKGAIQRKKLEKQNMGEKIERKGDEE